MSKTNGVLAGDAILSEHDAEGENIFAIDIEGFEGPLHLLLELARKQKVDLLHVSMTELAEQYLAFIRAAQTQRMDLAADYLLMAAWLAFLKSKLLLPKAESVAQDEDAPEDMAARLAFRLKRLDAMREAGDTLMDRAQLGLDVFVRGAPEKARVLKTVEYDTTLYHLTQAFGTIRDRKTREAPHRFEQQFVLPLETARDSLRQIGLSLKDWASLDSLRDQFRTTDADIPEESVIASVFSAALELTRDGDVDVRQDRHFGPLYLRSAGPQREGAMS
ncbi:MAG: ScpA family protein [Pseudomonadota bacterium]